MCYHTAIIGGGPAGCGLLTNHALNNDYEELLNQGVVVFEASPSLGGGTLDQYQQIRSNSHGCAFFDAFKDLGLASHDDSLNKGDVIPMSELYHLQEKLGEWHQANLEKHPVSQAFTCTIVLDVTEQDDGTYLIRYVSNKKDKTNNNLVVSNAIVAKNVCICTGGKAYTPAWLKERNVTVEAANDYFSPKIAPWTAADQNTAATNGDAKKVAIVGFSHSAFSLGYLWHTHSPKSQITYILRNTRSQTMPYIYFPSVEDANQANYSFVRADVCEETGRVHRFGGLRGDAREFSLKSHLYNTISIDEFREDDFDHVIVACGFQINLVPLFDKNRRKLIPEYSKGGTKVDAKGRLFDNQRIYAFGVGAGLAPNEEVGGEPGCKRRSDGIWLYQYTVGSIIRKALKET